MSVIEFSSEKSMKPYLYKSMLKFICGNVMGHVFLFRLKKVKICKNCHVPKILIDIL